MNQPQVRLTIVYDNHAFDTRLQSEWGFACIVAIDKSVVLFDTGGDGTTLRKNMATLCFDPDHLDAIVLSHDHRDHTGGLQALLNDSLNQTVYAPHTVSEEIRAKVNAHNYFVPVCDVPMWITDHVRMSGVMGTTIAEQALVIETASGLTVITGCAHPGIAQVVQQVKATGDINLLVGGFHLKDKNANEIADVIAELQDLGVQKVAPCHCTGASAIQQFKSAFGPNFIPAGVGATIPV
jgi:7,8-dihydropterin-6-yl-methyl-4-(beta-D-ribofuranosyl)aminobenzene 5'-phosphate synthase